MQRLGVKGLTIQHVQSHVRKCRAKLRQSGGIGGQVAAAGKDDGRPGAVDASSGSTGGSAGDGQLRLAGLPSLRGTKPGEL